MRKIILISIVVMASPFAFSQFSNIRSKSSVGVRQGNAYSQSNLVKRLDAEGENDTSVLGGNCVYKESWCPGAQVYLKDASNKVLQTATISNRDGFKFMNLSAGTYTVEIDYKSKKKNAVLPGVPSGRFVTVNFDSDQN